MSLPPLPGDFGQILAQAARLREDLEKAKASLKQKTVEGRAGGGMVTAVCDGSGELLRVRFEPGLLAKEEPSVVEDLVVAAVRDARRRAAEIERETMSGLAGGLPGAFGGFPGLSDLLKGPS